MLLVGFTLILPAIDDLEAARFYRDRLQLVEQHRDQRIGHYSQYLHSVERRPADGAVARGGELEQGRRRGWP